MPMPGDDDGKNIKSMPSSPSVCLQLHQEFAVFRTTILNDMKTLLQAALQDVLDQHEVLNRNQECSIKDTLRETFGEVRQQLASSQPFLRPGDNSNLYAEASPPCDEWGMSLASTMGTTDSTVRFTNSTFGKDTGMSAPETEKFFSETKSKTTAFKSRRSVHAKNEMYEPIPEAGTHKAATGKKGATGVASNMVLFGRSARLLKDGTAIECEIYDVRNSYKTTGVMQKIARSEMFSNITLFIIISNAIYMAVDADHNKAATIDAAEPVYIVLENFFCVFFTIELYIRFGAFEIKRACMKDSWFKFDLFLVALMILETWVLPAVVITTNVDMTSLTGGPIRLVRLLRLARMNRIMRSVPELVTMVKGMFVACRAVASALLMLGLLTYVFAIVMHSFLKDNVQLAGLWSTISECMWSLLVNGIFLDSLGTIVRELRDLDEVVALGVFLAFVLVSATTVMNMLIGVLCEVVTQVATAEKENAARAQLRENILHMLKRLDKDGSGDITKEELLGVITDPDAIAILYDLEVDIPHFLEIQDMLYEDHDSCLTISQIMHMILECRGDRATTMQDLVNGHTFTRWTINNSLDTHMAQLKEQLAQMVRSIGAARAAPKEVPTGIGDRITSWMAN